jgi:hypothetical protein
MRRFRKEFAANSRPPNGRRELIDPCMKSYNCAHPWDDRFDTVVASGHVAAPAGRTAHKARSHVMSAEAIESILCERCLAEVEVGRSRCPQCGAPTGLAESPASAAPAQAATSRAPTPDEKLRDNPWVILLLLFAALGPLAFGQLWKSRAFSRPMKIFLTVLTSAVTVLVVWLLVVVVQMFIAAVAPLWSN